MSLISELKTKAAGAPTPADLQFQISQAEDALANLQEQYGSFALDALGPDPSSKTKLADLEKQIAAARDHARMLKAAHAASEKRATDLMLAQRRTLQKSQFLAASKHLDIMNEAVSDYAKAISDAATAYRKMQEHAQKARAACPIMTEWPRFGFGENELRTLASGEAYRHTSGQIGGDPLTLPGAVPSHADYIGDPARMPPMAETVRATNDDVKAALKKQLLA